MAHLVYYSKEREIFKDAFEKEISTTEATIIYRKLCRHFKLNIVSLHWTSGGNRPKCSRWRILLNYDWNNFGVLCHEVAHLYMFQKLHEHGHNKKHWRIMKRMINYCEKKNWFQEELERRTAPKLPKPEPTKLEIRLKKIERLESSIGRHQTKIKRCTTLVKKANRRISALKRFI